MFQSLARILVLVFCVLSLPAQASDKFVIDKSHSYILWYVDHLGFSTQSGKWFVNGTIELDRDNLPNSKVDVSIDMASLVTGDPELDQHLKGKEFFDVAQHPQATFKSSTIEPEGKDAAKVNGVLTLHGVSKPVTLMVKFNKEGMNPVHDRKTLGFSATSTIKRSDFEIKTLIPQVGDEVRLDINLEAYEPK